MGETERDIDEEAGVHYQRLAVNSCLGQRANVVLSMAISSNHKPSTQTYIASICSSLPLNVIKLIMSIIQLSQVAAQSILHMCKIVHIVRHCPIHSRHAGFFLQGKAGSLNQSRRKMVEKTKKNVSTALCWSRCWGGTLKNTVHSTQNPGRPPGLFYFEKCP